jgi:peptide/nickel transport system permease protein
MRYEDDTSQAYAIEFLVRGSSYSLLGLVDTDIHLFGTSPDGPRVRLLGTDALGRDRFSRLVYATRFSLIVSPLGMVLACVIGIFVGAVSGYSHRAVDGLLMAVADTMISLPTLILILAARAAFPLELPPVTAGMMLVSIFALTGWAEMARLTRGLVVSVRTREYVTAARSVGASEAGILWRHVLPNIASPLVIQATLILPAFLLAEVALSFLGIGLQEPEPSLGNMLSAAGDITQLSNSPFLTLSPAIVIFLFVLGLRLIGWHRNRGLD